MKIYKISNTNDSQEEKDKKYKEYEKMVLENFYDFAKKRHRINLPKKYKTDEETWNRLVKNHPYFFDYRLDPENREIILDSIENAVIKNPDFMFLYPDDLINVLEKERSIIRQIRLYWMKKLSKNPYLISNEKAHPEYFNRKDRDFWGIFYSYYPELKVYHYE